MSTDGFGGVTEVVVSPCASVLASEALSIIHSMIQ